MNVCIKFTDTTLKIKAENQIFCNKGEYKFWIIVIILFFSKWNALILILVQWNFIANYLWLISTLKCIDHIEMNVKDFIRISHLFYTLFIIERYWMT